MSVLHTKLYRELFAMKGQALAIAMVVAGGAATFVLSSSTLDSLSTTQSRLYAEFRFADIFAGCKRAPNSLLPRILEIPGVQSASTRVAAPGNLNLESFPDPITAQFLSLPESGQPELNRLFLKAGRLPDPVRDNEALVSDGFAEAHNFGPGQQISATIFGRRRLITITGIVSSPEYIFQVQPGSIVPDFKSYAILWMPSKPLEASINMREAFNQIALRIDRNAIPGDVILRLDQILSDYGGLGAHTRDDQISHKYLSEEFKQLRQMATIFPVIFLSVAAFLLNVVMSRLMATQRSQIAILKAFGYSTRAIAVHYLQLSLLIVFLGALLGLAAGAWMGRGMTAMYQTFYRFPYLDFVLNPAVILSAAGICLAAACAGALFAIGKAAAEPPASAMQPASPGLYKPTLLERLGFGHGLAQPTRMILRNIERRPVKSALSVVGVALSVSILVTGGFWGDAIDFMVDFQFNRAQRDNLTVTFIEPVSQRALYSLGSLDGVRHLEPFRSVPVRLRHLHREYRTALQGIDNHGDLRRVLNENFNPVDFPEEGIVLTDHLARILHVRPGDVLTVDTLDTRRVTRHIPVAALIKEYIGVNAYMHRPALNRILGEGHAISGAYIASDPAAAQSIQSELRRSPAIAGIASRSRTLSAFYETMAQQMLIFAFFNTILAASIAIGVVYNTARISFSERSRELASLRVLGYTRAEISYILLGELALLVLAGIPLGLWFGRVLGIYMVNNMQSDVFRIPTVISAWSYSFAALIVCIAAVVSGLLVRRKLDHMDLVEVLKTRE
jgi:putative ABC transport system permease protein